MQELVRRQLPVQPVTDLLPLRGRQSGEGVVVDLLELLRRRGAEQVVVLGQRDRVRVGLTGAPLLAALLRRVLLLAVLLRRVLLQRVGSLLPRPVVPVSRSAAVRTRSRQSPPPDACWFRAAPFPCARCFCICLSMTFEAMPRIRLRFAMTQPL